MQSIMLQGSEVMLLQPEGKLVGCAGTGKEKLSLWGKETEKKLPSQSLSVQFRGKVVERESNNTRTHDTHLMVGKK